MMTKEEIDALPTYSVLQIGFKSRINQDDLWIVVKEPDGYYPSGCETWEFNIDHVDDMLEMCDVVEVLR